MQLVESVPLLLLTRGVLETKTVSVAVVVATVLSVPGVAYIDGAEGVTTGGGVVETRVTKGGVM